MTDRLRLQHATYTVMDFLEWQRQGSLDLHPVYQRRSVWTHPIKSLLIDSMIRGYPFPLVFLHSRVDVAKSKNVRQVVDGQQRLRTVLSFVDIHCIQDADDRDDFTILRIHNGDFAGAKFRDLPEEVQSSILQTEFSVDVLPPNVPDVTVLKIFQRMNSTGLKLRPQEIRNATFFGAFKDVSYSLAYEQNQRWLDWGLFSRQEIAEMSEVEFTSDLLGAMIRGVSGRSAAQIDALYKEFDTAFPLQGQYADNFRIAMSLLSGVFDSHRAEVPPRFRSTSWFYPLFCLALGLSDDGNDPKNAAASDLMATPASSLKGFDPTSIVQALIAAEHAITSGALPEELSETLRRQTTHKASRLQRMRLIRRYLN